MTNYSWLQIVLYLVVLLVLAKPLGAYMARVFQGERTFISPVVSPIERTVYRLTGLRPTEEMDWKVYALAMLLFNLAGFLVVYLLQ